MQLAVPDPMADPAHDIPVMARRIGTWRISLHRRAMSTPELTESYDRAAAGWHRTVDRLGVPVAYEGLLREALASSNSRSALRVLDCGVGTGALSSALLRVTDVPVRLDAVDLSPGMLEQAAARLDGADVTLRQGDVQHLPYSDGTFDLVMAAHLLEHLPDPGIALAEMTRCTRPGGTVLVCLTRRSALGLGIHLRWRTHMVDPAQAERWLAEAGLTRVRCLAPRSAGPVRQLSIACVGIRPH